MATKAGDLMFRCVLEGSLSMCDMEIELRPYHRNCKCALHKQKCTSSNVVSHRRNISFPKKELWNKCLLVSVSASTISSPSYVDDSALRSRQCRSASMRVHVGCRYR